MKITETITSTTTTIILSSLFGLFGILLGSIYSEVLPIIFPTLTQQLSTTVLLKMLSVAIILFFLSVALTIFVYLRYKPKLKPKCGILWDKDKEAYCPACKTLLSGYTEQPPEFYFFWCHSCKARVYLHHGNPISLSEAKKLL